MVKSGTLAAVMSLFISAAGARAQTSFGPDVIVGDINEVYRWGNSGEVTGYSLGTVACNIGNTNVLWQQNTPNHPVIAQNLYRLRTVDGASRLEQIGLSWVKHGFLANAGSLCGTCSGQAGQVLGVGCSDPYNGALNGTQTSLGPRSEVNAFTGEFPFPFVLGWGQSGGALLKRMQIPVVDADPALNAGATYFAEVLYVTRDDAAAGNGFNNVSWRRVMPSNLQSGGWNFGTAGTTRQRRAAIEAWPEFDSTAQVVTVNVLNEGRFFIGHDVTDLGNGRWRYEYAVFNLNSHRSARGFRVYFDPIVSLTNVEFDDVDYHSGEPYDGTDWTLALDRGASWKTTCATVNPNANALRWGTMYNFRFDADRPPTTGTARITLFRNGSISDPASVDALVRVPSPAVSPLANCPGDTNGDRRCNNSDLSILLSQFNKPICASEGADLNGDGLVNNADLSLLLNNFNTMCP